MSDSTRTDVNPVIPQVVDGAKIPTLDLTSLGSDWTTPLKISHAHNIQLDCVIVPQGQENAIDIDVSEDIRVNGTILPGQGQQGITIKGGSKRVTVGTPVFPIVIKLDRHARKLTLRSAIGWTKVMPCRLRLRSTQ